MRWTSLVLGSIATTGITACVPVQAVTRAFELLKIVAFVDAPSRPQETDAPKTLADQVVVILVIATTSPSAGPVSILVVAPGTVTPITAFVDGTMSSMMMILMMTGTPIVAAGVSVGPSATEIPLNALGLVAGVLIIAFAATCPGANVNNQTMAAKGPPSMESTSAVPTSLSSSSCLALTPSPPMTTGMRSKTTSSLNK